MGSEQLFRSTWLRFRYGREGRVYRSEARFGFFCAVVAVSKNSQ